MGVAGAVVRRAATPAGERGAVGGLVLDLTRSRKELLVENAFLRHQLVVAVRKVKRPKLRAADRIVLVGLAALFASWRNALVLVQPETLLRWHRDLFRRFWARRTKPKSPPSPKFGRAFGAVASGAGTRVVRTPVVLRRRTATWSDSSGRCDENASSTCLS